ncbi:hypothetical protein EJ06DRAFT_462917, partial [Trichodelitschia bisporula]
CEQINPKTRQQCNKSCADRSGQRRHEGIIHDLTRQKPCCVLCDPERTFTTKSNLNQHMRTIHPGV